MSGYDPQTIEAKWQQRWDEANTFAVPGPGDEGFDTDKPKYYVLDMFPYPSGIGLHVGHPLGYIATDITARYKRMRGFNVLHPMGFDAFGLPAEQFAVEHGVHPRVTTEQNIENMIRQLKRLGLSYDWGRQISTTDVDYYKWTQWIFLQLYHSYFNAWEQRAKPIAELVGQLENEELYVNVFGELVINPTEGLQGIEGDPIGVLKWHELERTEQREIIDSHRLAYLAEVPVNWCPALGTVLANEEVTNDGRSERGNHPVYKRPLKQWMLRITAYCERLGDDLDLVDWPEPIKLMQRNWIGRSEGALVDFAVDGRDDVLQVFTTRPDTLFGATYMVLAPEHELVGEITTMEHAGDVAVYQKQAAAKTDVDRQVDSKEKTGVPTGAYAINPVNGERIPIWIADYVMMGYGTGAIMAVPAHDDRDFAFAKAFGIPIVEVVQSPDDHDLAEAAWTGEGVAANCAGDDLVLDGLATVEAKAKTIDWLQRKRLGKGQVQYKLRDWLFSRQRYWGEPFPILHGPDGEIRPVDAADLPIELPPMDDFSPSSSDDPNAPPAPPLSRAPEDWRVVEIDGVHYERELNTMPQWAGSCWYYLRFIDPKNSERFVGYDAERYWMLSSKRDGTPHNGGVDLYVGGAEHAVLHLLYARFWHKVLFDLGEVSTPEPFGRLFNQGYIQAYCYRDPRGIAVPAAEVVNQDGKPAAEVQGQKGQTYSYDGEPATEEYGKMGKGLKNAVSPDAICEEYGADTLRLYEMYLGPLEQSKPWNTRDIVGVHRFLQRVWRNFVKEPDEGEEGDVELLVTHDDPHEDLLRPLHKTIQRVTDAMDRLSFNTAIAALIELNNAMVAHENISRDVAVPFVLMLSPLAPHMAAELWERLECDNDLFTAPWPRYEEKLLVDATIEIPVQLMGKIKARVVVPSDSDENETEGLVMSDPAVKELLADKTVRKIIVVPGKLVNIVAN